MQTICTSLQTDNHTNTSSLNFTGRVLFLTPNQQCQSTEGADTNKKFKSRNKTKHDCWKKSHSWWLLSNLHATSNNYCVVSCWQMTRLLLLSLDTLDGHIQVDHLTKHSEPRWNKAKIQYIPIIIHGHRGQTNLPQPSAWYINLTGSHSLAYKNSRTFPGAQKHFPGPVTSQQCWNIATNSSY